MALFHPRKVSRLRAWLDARRGVKAGRPLPAYLADKLAVAQRQAPRGGAAPYALTIEGDGSVLRASPSVAVQDPLTLPLDTDLRIKRGGSTAGHHGLDSLVSALRSPDFFRIRVGIGRPARRHENVDFVLDRFSKREWREVDVLIEDAADAVLSIIDDGLEATQNHFNRGGIAP